MAAVAPAKTSVLGTRAGAPTALPPSRVMTGRPVVSRVAPPARPVPFDVREGALAKTPGRPLDAQTETQLRSNMSRHVAPAAQAPTQPMQPVRPGSPMATSPSGIQPRPVPHPGGPQTPSTAMGGTDSKPATTSAQPAAQPAQPPRPGSPVATSPNEVQPRPVPRPGRPEMPSGNADAGDPKPMTTAQPPQPVSSGRPVPRPPQPGVQSPPAAQSESSNVGRPSPRPVQAMGTGNQESPRTNTPSTPRAEVSTPRPGASTGVIRPSVDNRPTAPRTPQSVSMPRSDPPSQQPSHAHTVVQAPRQNAQHENKAQQSKREEKSDRKPNR
jgi:hypothetical protein